MRQVRLLISGVFMNWAAFAVAVVVAFFISPFVVHHLGNVVYGVWVLANSSIAYMALLDLGLRGAVTHFVAKHQARQEHIESSRAVSVALAFRILIGLVVLLASITLGIFSNRIFRIPPELWTAARWAIIITGFNLAATLIFGVFGGVLTALQRFDLSSGITVAQTLINTAGTVWVLDSGHSIVSLALMQLAVSLVLGVVTVLTAFRVYRGLQVGIRFLESKILRELWRYSFYLFVIAVSGQIVYYTDNLVVGGFLSAAAVTFYAIGGRFIDYLGQLGASLAQTFMPVASNLAAQGRQDQLRRLLIHGTRATLFVSLPIGLALFVRGPTFIGLWMGPAYAEPSGQVLRILLLTSLTLAGNRVAGNIVFGMGKHKPYAIWQSCEAIANLSLSIFLVRKMGIDGVAWGTVIPSLVSQLVIWPNYITRLLQLRVRTYVWQGWMRPVFATLPFCAGCAWSEHHWVAKNMLHFFLQIGAILPLFPLGVVLFFYKEVSSQLRDKDSVLRRSFFNKLHGGQSG